LHCTPQNPACQQCIFQNECFACLHSLQQALPAKAKAKAPRKRHLYYIVVQHGKSLLMKKRTNQDIWLGLYDFPLIEKNKPVKVEKLLQEVAELHKLTSEKDRVTVSDPYKHVLTHQTIFATFIVVQTSKKRKWVDKEAEFSSFKQILNLPKPVLVSRFLADHYLL